MKRILVPLDGSPVAEAILPHLRMLLSRIEAEAVLFQSVYVCPSFYKKDYTRLRREDHARAKAYLEKLTGTLAGTGMKASFRVGEGPPPQAILDAAREERADLIVMTTHGRSGVLRWVMGSVAELVMQGADVPVLLHRSTEPDAEGDHPEREGLGKILVPVDGSSRSMEILPHASRLAKRFHAEILLLHVCNGKKSETLRRLEKLRKEALRIMGPGEPTLRMIHRCGDPEEAVLKAARENEVDLIAMTTHGENMKPRWTLGRVSEEVLRHTPIPMLVIRSTAEKHSRTRKTERKLQGAGT